MSDNTNNFFEQEKFVSSGQALIRFSSVLLEVLVLREICVSWPPKISRKDQSCQCFVVCM